MRFYKDEAGFSLLELVVSLVILCIIIPLSTFFVNSIKTNKLTEEQLTANHLAQRYMEKYKAMSFADPAFTNISNEIDPETNYHVEVTVEFAPVPELDIFAATLEISKKPSNGKPIFHMYSSAADESVSSNQITGLKVIDEFGEKLALVKANGHIDSTIPLDIVDPASDKRIISVIVVEDVIDSLFAENTLEDVSVVFNIAKEDPDYQFDLTSTGGKVGTVNTKKIEKYERGAKITVVIKDEDNSEELVKIVQTRKINE